MNGEALTLARKRRFVTFTGVGGGGLHSDVTRPGGWPIFEK